MAVRDVLERRQRAVQHRHAGLVGVHRVVDPLRRRPIDGAGERDVNRLEDTPLDGEQMGREDEVTCESALPREGGPQLREVRSEEHTSELQSQSNLVCRLLLEKKNHTTNITKIFT